MERLIPLNHMTRLNLVVILGACKGFWGLQMLQPGRGASAFQGAGAQKAARIFNRHKMRFDEQWRRFFFVDDFPENAKRLDIKLEDCLPKRRP